VDNYSFRLADEIGWQLMVASADHKVSEFVEKFAGIVGLRSTQEEGLRKIFFLRPDELRHMQDSPCISLLSPALDNTNGGWIVYDHKSLKVWCHETGPDAICEVCDNSTHDEEIMNMWIALQPIFQQAQKTGGLPLHGALLELDGKGIIIAAPGATGKSTCCRRVPDYWNPLCDDELLVVIDKERGYLAHPFPTWSDYLWKRSEKTWDVEYSVPVQAVFFLQQAETDEVVAVGSGHAAILINNSATQVCRKFWKKADDGHRRELNQQLFSNACEMAKVIPAYTLKATLDGRFWEEIERELRHGQSGILRADS
jgi:SynChlorMet cassette protein ScmC